MIILSSPRRLPSKGFCGFLEGGDGAKAKRSHTGVISMEYIGSKQKRVQFVFANLILPNKVSDNVNAGRQPQPTLLLYDM